MAEKKVELSVIDKILSKIGLKAVEVKLESMKLDDGQTIVEAEVFEAGQPISIVTEDDQRIALPVGEYGMEDGRMIIVQEEGIIFEIKEKASEDESAKEDEPVAASAAPTATPVAKKVVESVSKESYFSKASEEEVIDLIARVVKMAMDEKPVKEEEEEEKVTPRVQNPERVTTNLSKNKEVGITEFLNNLKS